MLTRGGIKTPNGKDLLGNAVEDESNASNKDDLKKLKKDNITYQETINRLVDHILS